MYQASAAGCPDDIVLLGVAVAEEHNPLVIVDVGCAAPARIFGPRSTCLIRNAKFRLDEEGVELDACNVNLSRLVDDVSGQGLLGVCDTGSMSLDDGMGFLAVSGA